MTEIIFWGCLVIIFYVYFGYPFILFLLTRIIRKSAYKQPYEPMVTILIAAFNEEKEIGQTIENKLNLDYPADKLEIIVISDESTDQTDTFVQDIKDNLVKLLRQCPRAGKTSALNMAVPHSKGDIIIFSDANSIYSPEVLKHLVTCFTNERVGYVTGKMIYINPDGPDGPSRVLKPGVSFLAGRSGAAVLPIGVHTSSRFQLPRWDRYSIPFPYSRICIVFGEPLTVARREDVRAAGNRVATAIDRVMAEAETRYHQP